jgi:hypothetical protein
MLVVFAMILATGACEESTSGADRVAPEVDAGSDGSIDRGPDASDAKVDPSDDAGPGTTVSEYVACARAAVNKCGDFADACGPTCTAMVECMLRCSSLSCQEACFHAAKAPSAAPFKACLLDRTRDDCRVANAFVTGMNSYAQRVCANNQFCAPALFSYRYRDLDDCQARVASELAPIILAPGSGVTGLRLIDCGLALDAQSCDDFFSARRVFACVIRGTRVLREPCIFDDQCESGFCPRKPGFCGTCALAPSAGEACAAGDRCGLGMICNDGTCAYQARFGQTCSATRPCESNYVCSGTCRAQATTPGAACGNATTSPTCDETAGVTCVSGTCRTFVVHGTGESCGLSGSTLYVCRNNAPCSGNKCQAPLKTGDACSLTQGPECVPPDECIDSKCTPPPAANACP